MNTTTPTLARNLWIAAVAAVALIVAIPAMRKSAPDFPAHTQRGGQALSLEKSNADAELARANLAFLAAQKEQEKADARARADAAKQQAEKTAWRATQPSVELMGKVEAVHPNGFVVRKAPDFISRTQMIISAGPPVYFVVAHPQQGQLAEGENVTMFGVRDGSETIQTANGQRVLARYHWMPTGKSDNR